MVTYGAQHLHTHLVVDEELDDLLEVEPSAGRPVGTKASQQDTTNKNHHQPRQPMKSRASPQQTRLAKLRHYNRTRSPAPPSPPFTKASTFLVWPREKCKAYIQLDWVRRKQARDTYFVVTKRRPRPAEFRVRSLNTADQATRLKNQPPANLVDGAETKRLLTPERIPAGAAGTRLPRSSALRPASLRRRSPQNHP